MKFLNQKFFYKLHTYLSLLFFIPLAVVCFSGAILVYKNEINNIFIPELVNANLKAQRISLDKIKEIVAKELNDYEMVGINIDANPKRCDKIWLIEHNDSQKEWKFIYFDAFSGKIKSEPLAHDEGFFGVLTELHESLFLEKSGHIILTLTAIFTFFICISGFVIYRKFWLTLLRLRVNRLNIFMSDIHKMIGIFSTPILLLICISGVWWEFQMARMPEFKNDFVIDAKIYNKSLSLDELVARSKK